MNPKDALTNPYFCPLPWTGLMYNFDGKVKNCIRSVASLPLGSIKDHPIEDIVQGAENINRQTSILKREPVPSCQPCYDLERGKKNFNIVSDRIFYIRELKKVPLETYTVGNFDLQTIDVRWTNLCNFSCVYCAPEFSSKWAQELRVQPLTPSKINQDQFRQYIFDRAASLRHVYLAGGEPLLMKENLELLERLDSEVNLRVNTNLSKVDTQVFEKICSFKNVHWILSVESMEEQFEYIRHGGNWDDFLENLSIIQKLNCKITFNMLHFLLNYQSLFECVDFFKKQGFHDNSFVIGPVLDPPYLNIRNLPKSVLQSLESELRQRAEMSQYLLRDSFNNMIHHIQQPFQGKLSNSFVELAKLDRRRGLDSSIIFEDLYKLKED